MCPESRHLEHLRCEVVSITLLLPLSKFEDVTQAGSPPSANGVPRFCVNAEFPNLHKNRLSAANIRVKNDFSK
jgi:hypothetical protein